MSDFILGTVTGLAPTMVQLDGAATATKVNTGDEVVANGDRVACVQLSGQLWVVAKQAAGSAPAINTLSVNSANFGAPIAGYGGLHYTKQDGIVSLWGSLWASVINFAANTGYAAGTLPVGFRPSENFNVPIVVSSPLGSGRLVIASSGALTVVPAVATTAASGVSIGISANYVAGG